MKIATRAFVAELDGERIEIAEGERVDPKHEVVAAYPDCFRDRPLEEELEIRSSRIAELDERDTRVSREPQTAAGRQAREEARFWERATRLVEETVPAGERAEQRAFDDMLAEHDAIEARIRQASTDELLAGWQGRLAG